MPSRSPGLFTELRAMVRGEVAIRGDQGYLAARPWNTSILFDPAAVVRVADAVDVAATFEYARANGFKVAVQATGHGAASRGRDTILIHTADLSRCDVDPEAAVAHIGAGVIASRLVEAAAEHGLAALIGSAATVGVVGYLTGGGVGPFVTTFGLSADYVTAFEVVTGDGEIRQVSATENTDLFWAFRGGKSALGIITELTMSLERLTHFVGGALWFDASDAPATLCAWEAWSATLPREVTTSVALMRMPPVGPPPALAGRGVVSVRVASTLDPAATETLLAPLRGAGPVILDTVAKLEYRQLGLIHNEPTMPAPVVQDQVILNALPAEGIDALAREFAIRDELTMAEIRRFGGALAEELGQPSAFAYRDARYGLSTLGLAPPGQSAAVRVAAQELIASVREWSDDRTLVNFVAPGDPPRVAMAFDERNATRLAELRAAYDPNGLLNDLRAP